MVIKYLLIQPDEDGAPNTFMTEQQLQEWLAEDEEHADEWKLQTLEFLTEEDLAILGSDQNYWGEKKRLLLDLWRKTIEEREKSDYMRIGPKRRRLT